MCKAAHQSKHTFSTTKNWFLVTKVKVYCVKQVTLTSHTVKVMKT